MRTLSLTEARAHLPELMDQVKGSREGVRIVRHGRPVARIISDELFESLVETLEILSDEEFMDGFRKAVKDVKAGRTISLEESKRRLGL